MRGVMMGVVMGAGLGCLCVWGAAGAVPPAGAADGRDGVRLAGTPGVVRAAGHTVKIVAHRGANEYAPENTLAAAALCVAWGVDIVEVDVRRTRDGVYVLLHDATLDRTTDGAGPVRGRRWDDVAELDAGAWFDPAFAGERVPRLDAFLAWAKGKIGVYLDVKEADPAELVSLVRAAGMEREVFYWAGNPLLMTGLRAQGEDVALKVNARSATHLRELWPVLKPAIAEVGVGALDDAGMVAAAEELGVSLMPLIGEKDRAAFARVARFGRGLVNLDHADVYIAEEAKVMAEGPGRARE